MPQLKIRNFGPITEGYQDSVDGFFDVNPLTVFIGEQGAGKSCVAKLFSTLSWLEKKVAQNPAERVFIDSFEEICLSFHRIKDFIKDNTEIVYRGIYCSLTFKNRNLEIIKVASSDDYSQPKILYIPAERVFCSSVTNPTKVNFLPPNLLSFMSDYYDALNNQDNTTVMLPLNGYEVVFDKKTSEVFVADKQKDYKIKLESSSSGLQSLIPLYITVKFFKEQISRPLEARFNEFSLDQTNKLKEFGKELITSKRITEEGLNETLESFKKSLREFLEKAPEIREKQIKRIVNSRMVCIIEEPEQNLFPESQYKVINELISLLLNDKSNICVITTHSPYILETINNCIYAKQISLKGIDISQILPEEYQISYDNIAAYKISNGKIYSIREDDIKQINPAEIDICSELISEVYTKLADAEYGAKIE